MSKDRIRPFLNWDEDKVIHFANRKEAERWLNRNKGSSGNSNNNNSNNNNSNDINVDISEPGSLQNNSNDYNDNDINVDISEPGSLPSSISSSSSKNSDYVKDPATDQESIWNEIKQRQVNERESLKTAHELHKLDLLRQQEIEKNELLSLKYISKKLNKIETELNNKINQEENDFEYAQNLHNTERLQFTKDRKLAETVQKYEDGQIAIEASDRELAQKIHAEEQKALQEKHDAEYAQKLQEKIAKEASIDAEQARQKQEALKQNIEYTKTASYLFKNYKSIAKGINTITKFAGFGSVIDESNSYIKHGAHIAHTLTSTYDSYLSGDLIAVFNSFLFHIDDYTGLYNKNVFAKCGIKAARSATSELVSSFNKGLASSAIAAATFSPSKIAASAGVTVAKCIIEEYAAGNEQYASVISALDTTQKVINVAIAPNKFMQGIEALNLVLSLIHI